MAAKVGTAGECLTSALPRVVTDLSDSQAQGQSGLLRCATCGHEHAWSHSGPCANCSGEKLSRTVSVREYLAVSETAGGRSTREFLEDHPGLKWILRGLAVGSPFVGFAVSGLPGVAIGAVVSVLSYWLGPKAVMKVREIRIF